MSLGERIKDKRESHGLTLKELSERIGVTEATLSRYESNQIKNPTQQKLKKLADALSVDINYLMDWENIDDADKFSNLNDDEKDLISIYRKLNKKGRTVLLGKVYELERLYVDDNKERKE